FRRPGSGSRPSTAGPTRCGCWSPTWTRGRAGSPAGARGGGGAGPARGREPVGRARGVEPPARGPPAALDRTLRALAGYAGIIADRSATAVRMVATSATRDAANSADFVRGVTAVLGVAPEVLTGDEEARLSFTGATAEFAAAATAAGTGGGMAGTGVGTGVGVARGGPL